MKNREEGAGLPDVVAVKPANYAVKTQPSGIKAQPALPKVPSIHECWLECFTSSWIGLRNELHLRINDKPSLQQPKIKYPHQHDEPNWIAFCLGNQGSRRAKRAKTAELEAPISDIKNASCDPNGDELVHETEMINEEIEDTESISEDSDIDSEEIDGSDYVLDRTKGIPPLISLLVYIPHSVAFEVLGYLTAHMQASLPIIDEFLAEPYILPRKIASPLLCRWIYALLTRLDPLLESDQIADLRRLGRTCKIFRIMLWRTYDVFKTPKCINDSRLFWCDCVLAILAHGFGQRDLL